MGMRAPRFFFVLCSTFWLFVSHQIVPVVFGESSPDENLQSRPRAHRRQQGLEAIARKHGKGTGGSKPTLPPPSPSPTRTPVRDRVPESSPPASGIIFPQTDAPSLMPSEDVPPASPAPSEEPDAQIPSTTTPPTARPPQSQTPTHSMSLTPFESSNAPVVTLSPSEAPSTKVISPTFPPQSIPTETTRCGTEGFDVFWDGLGEIGSNLDSSGFENSNSYQCRALYRLFEQEGYQNFSFAIAMKYWVLYCIYFATNGASKLASSRQFEGGTWLDTQGWQESNLDPCDGWYGISCDSSSRVTEIYLARQGLNGVFPSEIKFLASDGEFSTGAGDLQKLEIFNNELLTNDGSQWVAKLGSSLRVLNYGTTSFKGPLPQLPQGIEEFDCSYALHSGIISDTVFQGLNNLTMLIMDGNNFVSPVPRSIASLESLKYFYVRDSGITGDLSYMRGMTSIVEHLVDDNPGLGGSIPPFLSDLTTLRSFSASDCSLVSAMAPK